MDTSMSRKLFLKVKYVKSKSSVHNWVLWENCYLKGCPDFLCGMGQKLWVQAELFLLTFVKQWIRKAERMRQDKRETGPLKQCTKKRSQDLESYIFISWQCIFRHSFRDFFFFNRWEMIRSAISLSSYVVLQTKGVLSTVRIVCYQ